MWEPRCLTTLWDFTACYRYSFTFFLLYKNVLYDLGLSRVRQVSPKRQPTWCYIWEDRTFNFSSVSSNTLTVWARITSLCLEYRKVFVRLICVAELNDIFEIWRSTLPTVKSHQLRKCHIKKNNYFYKPFKNKSDHLYKKLFPYRQLVKATIQPDRFRCLKSTYEV
jgi:hypothetical protein